MTDQDDPYAEARESLHPALDARRVQGDVVEALAVSLHDYLHRGSWRAWLDLEVVERRDYRAAARAVLAVLTALGWGAAGPAVRSTVVDTTDEHEHDRPCAVERFPTEARP